MCVSNRSRGVAVFKKGESIIPRVKLGRLITCTIRLINHWLNYTASGVDEPVVDLENGQTCLLAQVLLLLLGWVWMLKMANQSLNHRLTVGESQMSIESTQHDAVNGKVEPKNHNIPHTDRFWNNHARRILVACFGNSPRFLFELLLPPRDSVSESPQPEPPELTVPLASTVRGSEFVC